MITDLVYNDDGTFRIVDGDFFFTDAAAPIMEDLLLSDKGHYKEFPTLGTNLEQYLNTVTNPQIIARDISVSLQADVFREPEINLDDFPETISIDNFLFDLIPDESEL